MRYDRDPSWENEINEFVECIIKNKKVLSGSSEDAYQTMEHVYKIYYADKNWRDKYSISMG